MSRRVDRFNKYLERQLQILSGTGQVVVNQLLDSTINVIPTTMQKNGMYLVVIGDVEHPLYSGKIMVLKD